VGFFFTDQGKGVKFCPDPKLITSPKTFASQNISGISPGKAIIVDHGKIVRIDLPSIPKITYLRLFCFLASAQ
jgi:hypothetical protein